MKNVSVWLRVEINQCRSRDKRIDERMLLMIFLRTSRNIKRKKKDLYTLIDLSTKFEI